MGWYTDLKIAEYNWSWRKTLPVEVPILFYGKHKIVGEDEEFTSEQDVFVGYEATVGQVISNLNNLGLTLDFFISTYGSYRSNLVGWGLAHLSGIKGYYEYSNDDAKFAKAKITEINRWISRVENGNPKKDIECAIQLLKDNVKLESLLVDDENLIPSLNHLSMDVDLNQSNILEATTFGTFLGYAHENLPEIAWLFEVRIILETLNKRSKVKLDLSELVKEGGSLDIITDSISSLGLKAKTYNRTFDAILGGRETFNIEYERSRITEKWIKLKSLTTDDLSKGAKLEDFIALLFHKNFGFEVLVKNLLVQTQELDLVLKNSSKNDFIKSLNSPFIIVECKNWSTPVGVADARVFESKYRELGNKVNLGFFIAINGVTKPFTTHVYNLIRDEINLIVITDKDIEELLYSENLDINEWLEKLISLQFIKK